MNSLRQISSWMRHTHTRSKSTLLCRCPRPNDHTRMRSRSICIMGTKEEMLDDCSSHEMKLLVRWERWMKKKIGLIKQYPLHVVYYMIFIYTVVVLKNRMIYIAPNIPTFTNILHVRNIKGQWTRMIYTNI